MRGMTTTIAHLLSEGGVFVYHLNILGECRSDWQSDLLLPLLFEKILFLFILLPSSDDANPRFSGTLGSPNPQFDEPPQTKE